MKYSRLKLAKYSLWLLFGILATTTNLKAQKTFTLDECLQYAFQNNQLVHAGSADTAIAELGTQRVSGTYLPRVNFAAAMQYYLAKRKLLVEGGSPLAPSTLPDGEAY